MNNLSDTEKIALSKRLTLFRNALEMTQEEFGKAIGKSRTTIFSWEKGYTQPPDHYIGVIEKATWMVNNEPVRINPHWLRTGEGEMFLKVVHKTFQDAGPEGAESFKKRTIAKLNSDINRINHKGEPELRIWGLIGAGDAFDIHMQETNPENMRPMETMKVSGLFEHKIKDCFRVDGDSMYPLVRRGALVGVDFKNKRIINGDLYALNLPAEGLVVKEVHPEGKKLKLHSYNERIKDYYLDEGEWEEYVIAGRIAWIWQDTNKM